jgi:hypothetical protein
LLLLLLLLRPAQDPSQQAGARNSPSPAHPHHPKGRALLQLHLQWIPPLLLRLHWNQHEHLLLMLM